MTLLRETDRPITDIAFLTGWSSLGTFGRTFHDVVGMAPSAFRQRERMAAHTPHPVPACVLRSAQRPELTLAVSEKRRRDASDRAGASKSKEVP